MPESALPEHASVVVIGGGVMGCSTLYHLAEAGVSDAVLLERNQLTSGTTWHSAAQVRALRSTRNLTDLIRYSIDLYSKLERETGQATGWINKGSLSIATNPERMTHIRRQAALAGLFDVEAEEVGPAEALERWPLMNVDDVVGAVWSPDDGRVSPSDLCAALIKGARSRGASVFEGTAVTGIVTRGGRIHGVHTTRGEIRCDAVAICTGLWSRRIAALADVDVPVWPCEHFYLLTRPIEGLEGNLPTLSDHDGHLYIRDDSGGLLVGCFEPKARAIDPDRLGEDFAFQLLPEDWDHFEPMMMNALHRLPPLADAEVKMLLNGPESFTPDGSFLLGETAGTQGLFLGCGMNSVGVATGGGAGWALAHQIVHGHAPMDLHEAEPNRFPDCFASAEALAARVPEVLGKHYEIAFPGRQWDTARDLVHVPAHAVWADAGAHFTQVHGYERPVCYGLDGAPELTFGRPAWFEQVGAEVRAAHEDVAVFDQSTFGKLEVSGADALAFLERVCTNRMDRPVNRVIYTLMLNERAGIEADLTAIRLGPEHFRLYVGTAARRRDAGWLRRHVAEGEDVRIDDVTDEHAVLGVMGPRALDVLDGLGAPGLAGIGYFNSADCTIAGVAARAARLSYVGEHGFELTCAAGDAEHLARALVDAGARPAGSFAQTAMRIEKRYLAYGHEMDTDTSPLEFGLGFAVAKDKRFIGSEALAARTAETTLMTLVFDDEGAVPLGNEPVLVDGRPIGKTTSAAFGYRVGSPVALALLKGVDDGQAVVVDVGGASCTARAIAEAAFDPAGERLGRSAASR